MKAYKIEKYDFMGYTEDLGYTFSKKIAIQILNNCVRKEINNHMSESASREDYIEVVSDIKLKDDEVLICKYPYIMTQKDGEIKVVVLYWEKTSYEYNEYDIYESVIMIKEIELN